MFKRRLDTATDWEFLSKQLSDCKLKTTKTAPEQYPSVAVVNITADSKTSVLFTYQSDFISGK